MKSSLRFNPVTKNGLFRVSDGTHTKNFRAVDGAEAKFKWCQKFNGGKYEPKKCGFMTLEETKRKYL